MAGFSTYDAKFEALLSAHYVAGIYLKDRKVTLDQFEPEYYDNPVLRDFAANKVEILADDSLGNGQAIAEIDTNDGKTVSARCDYPLGAPENPLSPEQLEEKLRICAGYCLADNKIDELAAAINDIENVGSVRELMTMMRSS